MKMYRVTLKRKFKDGSEDASYNISLDIQLDANGRPSDKFPWFGCLGGLKSDSAIAPFCLYKDGHISFGTDFEGKDWAGKTNLLRGTEVRVGEYFAFEIEHLSGDNDETEFTYQVMYVTLLE